MLLFHLHHNYCGKDGERSQARDMRPSITGQPHRLQTSTSADRQVIASTPRRPHQYFLPDPQGALPKPPIPLACGSRFLDWFHLFNDGCANDPSHVADGVIDTRTCQEWGLDRDLAREGRVLLKRAGWSLYMCMYERQKLWSLSFPNKQGHWMQNGNWKPLHGETFPPWHRWKETSPPLITAWWLLARLKWILVFWLCDSCRERHGYTEDTIWVFFSLFSVADLGEQRKRSNF